MTSQQRNQQMNNEVLMNNALRTMNLVCDGKLQDKINVFLSHARSLSLKKMVDRSLTMNDKVELISQFTSIYGICSNSDTFDGTGLNNSKPIDVSSIEEKMIWDMRTYAMKLHNNFSVRNKYFKSGRMDEWYDIEKRICLFTHSIIYQLNEEKKKEGKIIEKVEAIKENVKRQRRCASPKKVTGGGGGLRQRSAKLDCKRKLRQYYLENDE